MGSYCGCAHRQAQRQARDEPYRNLGNVSLCQLDGHMYWANWSWDGVQDYWDLNLFFIGTEEEYKNGQCRFEEFVEEEEECDWGAERQLFMAATPPRYYGQFQRRRPRPFLEDKT